MASKLPEPFRKPAAMLGSLAKEWLLPADDDLMGQMMPPAPMVSMYKNPAVRKMFTDEAIEELKAIYSKHLHGQIDELGDKIPRTLAHSKFESYNKIRDNVEGQTRWSEPEPNWQENIEGTRFPVDIDVNFARQAGSLDTPAHELGHVAQRLGNKEMPELYTLMQKGMQEHPSVVPNKAMAQTDRAKAGGYQQNPAEVGMRMVGLRKGRFSDLDQVDQIKPRPVMNGLHAALSTDPNNKYLQDAMDIMMRRRSETP